jgi:hypothetical protein
MNKNIKKWIEEKVVVYDTQGLEKAPGDLGSLIGSLLYANGEQCTIVGAVLDGDMPYVHIMPVGPLCDIGGGPGEGIYVIFGKNPQITKTEMKKKDLIKVRLDNAIVRVERLEMAVDKLIQKDGKTEPEDGADLNAELVPWDYKVWKEDPNAWQPVTRDGREVNQLTAFYNTDAPYPLGGVISGKIETFRINGGNLGNIESCFDITHMRRVESIKEKLPPDIYIGVGGVMGPNPNEEYSPKDYQAMDFYNEFVDIRNRMVKSGQITIDQGLRLDEAIAYIQTVVEEIITKKA